MDNVIPESLAETIIANKVKEWQEKHGESPAPHKPEVHSFLAISRDFGCGEEKIIPKLEKSLGWQVYGKSLIDHMATQENLNKKLLESLDEKKQSFVDEWMNYLIRSGSILKKDYVLKVSRLIETVVLQENAIIVGRGANFILKNRPEGLRVKLTAPFKNRAENTARVRNLSEKEAEELVRQNDEERRQFIQNYFEADAQSHCEFDIAFNTAALDADWICDAICALLKEKAGGA